MVQRRYAVRVAIGAVRVGVDVTPLLGNRTGVGQFVAALVDGFAADPSSKSRSIANASADIALHPFSVTAKGWRSGPTQTTQRWPMPARPLRELWRKFDVPPIEWWTGALDVVHGTNFVVPPAKRAVELVSVHDMTTVRFPELCTPDTLQYPQLIARALDRGAHVHTDSAFVAGEVIEHFGVEPARVHTIHIGLPFNGPCPPDSAEASRADGAPFLLAIGTIEPRKDYPSLLRAFGLVARLDPDLRLVIVGQPGWGEQAFAETLAQLPKEVCARIDRRGFVDERERQVLLRGASVLVYPSVYEGFGLPPLEAMVAGVPVVATTAGSLPEILGDAALLVEPSDHVALAGAIQRVLGDSVLSRDLQSRGYANVARFSISTMVENFTGLYGRLGSLSGIRQGTRHVSERRAS